jgi:hypothetical protein
MIIYQLQHFLRFCLNLKNRSGIINFENYNIAVFSA